MFAKFTQILSDIWSFRKPAYLAQQLWTSLIVHFNGILTYISIGVAIGMEINILYYILIVPLVFLFALMPISFAGWGIRETGAMWLFGLVGVSQVDAVPCLLLLVYF